jgi:hypothetical protein
MISVPQGRHGFPKEQTQHIYGDIFAFLEKRGISRK